MTRFEAKLADITQVYRWWIIAITLTVVAFTGFGLTFLTVDSDLRVFFSKGNPQLEAFEEFEKIYTKSEHLIFIVAPKDGKVFTKKTLTAVEKLTESAWQIPYSYRVDSLTNFQYTHAQDDDLIVESFIDNADQLSLQQIKQKENIALNEPLLVNRLLAADGRVTGIHINIIFQSKTMEDVAKVSGFGRQLRDSFRTEYPSIDFYLTGSVMFDTAFSEVGRHDMVTLSPIMFLVLIVVVAMWVRSISAVFATMLVILFSAITAMGIAGWIGISINPASASAPTIILTLAVADSVHILVMACRLICQGKRKQEAIKESLSFNLQAVFLTSLTTAVGFLTMNFSDAPPFHDLGNIVAIGICCAFFYSIFFLPAMMSVLPTRVQSKSLLNNTTAFETLAAFVVKRHHIILWIMVIVVLSLSVATIQNKMNDNWIKNFSNNIDVRVATDYLENNLSGSDYIEYSLSAGQPGGINEPRYLETLDTFANWLYEQSEVVHVYVITDVLKRLNRNMHNDDKTWYRLPQERELAAQYLLLYEMSLPLGLDLNNQINVDKSATRIVVSVKNQGTIALRALDNKVQAWVQSHAPEYILSQGTGLSMVWAHLSLRNITNMLTVAFGALIAISTILVVALKRIDLGLLSLIPNLVPATMGFGLWAIFVGEIGLGLSVVVSMTLGIVVDDTIHFISKYLRVRRLGKLNSADSIHHAFNTVGPAMWVTTIALVAGFLVLTFSDYKMSSDMGLLSAITISIALVMDFSLLPALLLSVDSKKVLNS
jgi:predicted RND superfamily exporter protein